MRKMVTALFFLQTSDSSEHWATSTDYDNGGIIQSIQFIPSRRRP